MWTPLRLLASQNSLGHRAGLVVGDDELAVLVELEPVDHAAQAHPAEVGFELELQADRPHRAGVFELEVALRRATPASASNCAHSSSVSDEVGEIGVGGELDPGAVEVDQRGVERALVGWAVEQELERPVHQRALGGPVRRRFGEALEVGEPERERALLEGRAGARRQGPRGCEAHSTDSNAGV